MAFPNTLFPCIPLSTEVSDEEYKLFHSIDRELISTLIHSLGRNSFDSISVVAFLLWLERSRLGVKAVYRVNLDWPNHLIDMLADQVIALLEWLKNPNLVWEMRGDISLIQELCTPNVGFVYLHQRRLEILNEKTEIVNEMAEKAFKDMFPGGVVDMSVHDAVEHGSGGGAVSLPRELVNRHQDGVQIGSSGGYVHGPREVEGNVGAEFAGGVPVYGDVGSGNDGGAVYDPRELVNRHQDGVRTGSAGGYVHGPREVEGNVGAEFAAGVPVYGDVGSGSDGGAVYDPRELVNRHQDGVRTGSAGGYVHGPREVEGNVGAEFGAGVPVYGDVGSGSGGGAVYVPRELVNRHQDGVRTGSAGGYVHGPREVEGNVGAEFAGGVPVYGDVGSGSGGGAVYVPRELVNRHQDGVRTGSAGGYVHGPREVEGNVGAEFAAGVPVYGPRELRSYNHDGAGVEFRGRYVQNSREVMDMNHFVGGYGSTDVGLVGGRLIHHSRQHENNNIEIGVPRHRLIYDPRQHYSINHNGLGYRTVSGLVGVHREPENMNGAGGFGTAGGLYRDGLRYGTASGLVQVHREPGAGGFGRVGGVVEVHGEPENMNGDGSGGGYVDDQILANVPFGPRLGYVESDGGNPGNSRRSEMINTRRPFSGEELAVLLSGLNIQEEETDVHEDDRTVFLTFSRGYPITEPEIWGFFTRYHNLNVYGDRKFGNFIKAINFEEVVEGVQPLYARMVARNSSILPVICDVNIRTRYVINGKHVWAKKYVRKHHTPPPRLSPTTVHPPPSP